MKKIMLMVLLVFSCCMFTGCTTDEDNLSKAQNLYENTSYEEALEILKSIKSDSALADQAQELVDKCEKAMGMRDNADNEFLETIEKSILGRMDSTETDYSILVNTELAYLEKFETMSFYDETLEKLAKRYIDGLNIQKESLKAEYQSQEQIEWLRGLVFREEVLNELHKKYDFLTENTEFIGTYIMEYEDNKKKLNAYDAVEEDISNQLLAEGFWDNANISLMGSGAELSFTVKNNTEYTYSTVYEFSFFSDDEVVFFNNSAYIENIKPEQSYVVNVYADLTNCNSNYINWHWYNYYTDIQY